MKCIYRILITGCGAINATCRLFISINCSINTHSISHLLRREKEGMRGNSKRELLGRLTAPQEDGEYRDLLNSPSFPRSNQVHAEIHAGCC
jgi:hypothetical protein